MSGPELVEPWDVSFARVAKQHNGLFTLRQLDAAGLRRKSLYARVVDGRVVQMLPQVYRLASVAETFEVRVRAAHLYARFKGVFCYGTAAWLLRLEGAHQPRVIEIASGEKSHDLVPWLAFRRLGLGSGDRYVSGGLAMTSATRTVLDMAGRGDRPKVEQMLDDALRRGLTSVAQLGERVERNGGRGFHGIPLLGELLEDPMLWGGKAIGSVMERCLWELLKKDGLPVPRLQHPLLDTSGRWVGNVDFAYPAQRLLIECDGKYFHTMRRDRRRDAYRDQTAALQGWSTLRLTWADLCQPSKVRRLLVAHGVRPEPRGSDAPSPR